MEHGFRLANSFFSLLQLKLVDTKVSAKSLK